jgi:hypothetical protein
MSEEKAPYGMPQEEETKYTPADLALAAGLLSVQTMQTILQAHIDGKIDLDTYNRLYAAAKSLDVRIHQLTNVLEGEHAEPDESHQEWIDALDLSNWEVTHISHTSSMDVRLEEATMRMHIVLPGGVQAILLRNDVEALARFLAPFAKPLPVPEDDPFEGFKPIPVDLEERG